MIGAAIGKPDLHYVQLPNEELAAILTEATGFSPDFEPPWVRRRVCGLCDFPVGGRGSSLSVMLFELNRGQVPD